MWKQYINYAAGKVALSVSGDMFFESGYCQHSHKEMAHENTLVGKDDDRYLSVCAAVGRLCDEP